MPELPEVETIVRQLQQQISGKTVRKVVIDDHAVVDNKILSLVPFKIESVHRRGKSIIMALNKPYCILTHLRMTGHFHHAATQAEKQASEKYRVAAFFLSDSTTLTHNSIRKFGRMTLLTPEKLKTSLSALGPEPLDISQHEFLAILDRYPHSNIKTKLMDQTFLAGLGNIYAQEILYHASISPAAKIGKINKFKKEKLYHHLQRLLKLAIKHHGTTVQNYSHMGGKGSFQQFLSVYQQQQCPKKHPLLKNTIGGRGTYYCPTCQR